MVHVHPRAWISTWKLSFILLLRYTHSSRLVAISLYARRIVHPQYIELKFQMSFHSDRLMFPFHKDEHWTKGNPYFQLFPTWIQSLTNRVLFWISYSFRYFLYWWNPHVVPWSRIDDSIYLGAFPMRFGRIFIFCIKGGRHHVPVLASMKVKGVINICEESEGLHFLFFGIVYRMKAQLSCILNMELPNFDSLF